MPNIVEIIARFINEVSPGLKQVSEDVGDVGKKSTETGESIDNDLGGSLNNIMGKLGLTVSAVGLATTAFNFLKTAIMSYGESELVAAQVNAVLQSTQSIAGITADEVDRLANSLSQMSGVDDEAIKRGEALMLTFTKVGKDVFPAATEAALNMSMAMGTDLQSSIIQVGKALNDPIQGATALRRVGVQLTDQQEEQIKQFMAVNDVASAQAVILNELETEFGNVARMMGDTTVGATNKLRTSWGNLMEEFGRGYAENYTAAVEGTNKFVDSTATAIQFYNEARGAIDAGTISVGEFSMMNLQAIFTSKTFSDMMQELGLKTVDATQARENFRRSEWDTTSVMQSSTAVLAEYLPNYDKLLSLTSNIASETERYNEKQQEITDKQAAIKAQIDELIAGGYSPLSEKVRSLQTDYDALGLKYDENAQKHHEAMGKIQYDLLLTKLAVGGLDDAEFEMMQQAGVMFGVFDEGAANAARQMDQVTQAVSEGKLKVQDMRQALEMMRKGYTIDVVINTIANLASANSGRSTSTAVSPSQLPRIGKHGYAEGGIAMGPDSGHWELLHGTEAVIPLQGGSIPVQFNGSNPMGGGGGAPIVVNVTIASPINLMTEQEAQTVLLPMVVEAVKQAQAEARL